jgi:NAD(P)-dependent dehydrogenase (short-subunit alcohol dehydrogenase family)
MNQEIVVVTGASSGFGLYTSLAFASRGYQVIAAMRNMEKGLELLNRAKTLKLEDRIQLQPLDVTSEVSIQNFKAYIEEIGKVDVLVNNAGYAGAGFVEEIPIAEYRKQFETNLFGLISVTQACLPLMRKQRKGKIINVSSISGLIGFPGMSPYVASKHALEGWSECLRLEMKPFGVDVSIIEPGSFKTNIWSTGKQVSEQSLQEDSPYYTYMKKLEEYIQNGESKFGNPLEVAEKIADIAQQANPSLRYPIGKGVKLSSGIKQSLPWKLWERIVFKKMN